MTSKPSEEFAKFDKAMDKILSVRADILLPQSNTISCGRVRQTDTHLQESQASGIEKVEYASTS